MTKNFCGVTVRVSGAPFYLDAEAWSRRDEVVATDDINRAAYCLSGDIAHGVARAVEARGFEAEVIVIEDDAP